MRRTMRWWILVLCSLSGSVYADGPEPLIEQYENALRQQSSAKLEAVLSEKLSVEVTLLMADEDPVTVSLSRDEFLQQQRALWLFSTEHAFDFSRPVVKRVNQESGRQRWEVTLEQQERYALFRSTLKRDNQITLIVEQHDDVQRISAMNVVTREW